MIEQNKMVTVHYELYLHGETPDTEELVEKTPAEHPLIYCHGVGMMLPAFEAELAGKNPGDAFDFTIPYQQAYGEHDPKGVHELDKKLFCIDGKFDDDRVYEGAIVPMNTAEGQIIQAEVIEITKDKVTIDLNHPLAGEDLHFKGTVAGVRDATEEELEAIRNPKRCGGCGGGGCGSCGSDSGCGNSCDGGCGGCCE